MLMREFQVVRLKPSHSTIYSKRVDIAEYNDPINELNIVLQVYSGTD